MQVDRSALSDSSVGGPVDNSPQIGGESGHTKSRSALQRLVQLKPWRA
jgi:hypothetical protein